ncbi:hypothetical protein [Halalkalibacter okhensis]|uniref:Uncharacterized protein n=1 Tax=Halalkalibacter okhensis TaxID=333138 RepID=A0A0B0IDI9_9BACI|nr:hypothetical protein [Halalkalibacter okhensis]KHF38907.1 hypothetical protein LQ50_18425 [Halalkalibacter okhensis]
MKYWFIFFGIMILTIFGGGFLIRFVRDGDFYIAEFIGGVIGLLVLIIGLFAKMSMKTNHSFLK